MYFIAHQTYHMCSSGMHFRVSIMCNHKGLEQRCKTCTVQECTFWLIYFLYQWLRSLPNSFQCVIFQWISFLSKKVHSNCSISHPISMNYVVVNLFGIVLTYLVSQLIKLKKNSSHAQSITLYYFWKELMITKSYSV